MARGDFPSSKQDQFVLRFPDGMRDTIKDAADQNGRSMNAEIIWRIEKFEEAAQAWANTDAAMSKLESDLEDSQGLVGRLYDERGELFEAMNNQERSLQSLRETHRTLAIMVKSLGEALLTDSQVSDFVRVLATGLAQVEIDASSEASEQVPHRSWETS